MKVVSKPIDVVAWFDNKGEINPIRFRVVSEEENRVIKIDKILTKEQEMLAGNKIKIFNCTSNIEGIQTPYQIKYEVKSCRWTLFKI